MTEQPRFDSRLANFFQVVLMWGVVAMGAVIMVSVAGIALIMFIHLLLHGPR